MTLFSAYEDFVNRTLGALDGTWEKLAFVGGLRGEKGRHEHWGLEYTHGPVAARKAMAQAHTEVFQKVLETPIPALSRDFETERTKPAPERPNPEQLIPDERNGCLPEHFRYVHTALTLLADSHSSRPTA